MVWFLIWLVIKVNLPNWDGVCQAVQREKWKPWNWNPASSNCQKFPIIRELLIIFLKFLWLKSQLKFSIIYKESWNYFYKNATKCTWMVDIKNYYQNKSTRSISIFINNMTLLGFPKNKHYLLWSSRILSSLIIRDNQRCQLVQDNITFGVCHVT